MNLILKITNSQRMAMLDELISAIETLGADYTFVDCSTDPPTETTLGDLLKLVDGAKPERSGARDA